MLVFHLDNDESCGTDAWRALRSEHAADAVLGYWQGRKYRLVAHVSCSDLEEAFDLTNHIDTGWPTNPEVAPAGGPQRSTSIGDLVMTDDGVFHVCLSVGWATVGIHLA